MRNWLCVCKVFVVTVVTALILSCDDGGGSNSLDVSSPSTGESRLTVTNGSGDGQYEPGETVAISADVAPSGQVFDEWIGGSSHVQNPQSPNTSVTMPSEDVVLRASYKDVSDPKAPIARWTLNETGGTQIADATGNGNHLSSNFSLSTASTAGQVGTAIVFSSSNNATHATLFDQIPSQITIAGWVHPDATGMTDTQSFLSKVNTTGTDELSCEFAMTSGVAESIRFVIVRGGTVSTLDSGITWADDTWYHYAATWDRFEIKLYINGSLAATDSTGGLPGNGSAGDFTIGSDAHPFKGAIDELRVYDRVLSASEIALLYNPSATTNLAPVVYAGFDKICQLPNNTAALNGTVTDDGVPGTGFTYNWSKVSGPGTVTFTSTSVEDPQATFSAPGTYVLRLNANDGSLSGSDDVQITVVDAPPPTGGPNALRPIQPVIYTSVPKPTANMAAYTQTYTIELSRFGISNDGTNAVETTDGINQALQYAKTINANRIVFPEGLYLIDEDDTITLDHKDTIIDLNGATLKVRSNDNQSYAIITIEDGAENMRLTNGTLQGDRDTHTYLASYEGGKGLVLNHGSNLEIDHLMLRDFTGSAVNMKTGLRAGISVTNINSDDLESGAFSATGTKITDATKLRSINAYSLSKFGSEFEVGYVSGYQGYPYITDPNYQAYFYDASMNFLEKRNCIQYKKTSVPAGAAYINVEFNQAAVEPTTGWCIRITNLKPPRDVHFHHNTMYRNRALHLSATGGQRWIIENNHFEKSGGQDPGFAIDLEDGWELVQHMVFRRNSFKDNSGDLVVVSGSELVFEDNDFTSINMIWGRAENYYFRNNRLIGDKRNENGNLYGASIRYSSRSGHAMIHGNHYENCVIGFPGDDKFPDLPALTVENSFTVNVPTIYGEFFRYVGATTRDTRFLASSKTASVEMINCKFITNTYTQFYQDGPSVDVFITNCTGTMSYTGTYVDRLNLH